jgi:hypothetical protein
VDNVIVPVGAALVIGIGGIWAARFLGGKVGKEWPEHFDRK